MARKKWFAITGGIVAAALVVGVGTAIALNRNNAQTASADTTAKSAAITITDVRGQEFTFKKRPTRIAAYLSSNVELLLALGLADKVVAIDSTSRERLSYTTAFSKAVDAGATSNDIDYEALVAANPDVVLLPEGSSVDQATEQLKPFNIPVVQLTVWHAAEWSQNLDLLGKLFGVQAKAAKAKALTDQVQKLLKRLDGRDPVSIYYEADEDYSTRGAGTPHDAQLTQGGFASIASKLTTNDIDPEFILTSNPEFVTRQNVDQSFTPSSDESFDKLFASLLARPGWNDLAAVENKNVVVYDTWPLVTAGWNFAPLYYAKWSHPDLFADVEPSKYVSEWTTEFLGAKYPGDAAYIHTLKDYLAKK